MALAAGQPRSSLNLRRNTWIDVLRGASVLLVIWLHLQIRIPFEKFAPLASLPREVWRTFFTSGNGGVRIFFTLSGFLITKSLLRADPQSRLHALKSFYRRRIAKIVPPLLLLMVGLTLGHFFQIEFYTIQNAGVSYFRALFSVLTFHVNWLEGQKGYLPGGWDILWSLSVEEVFYLGYPILIFWVRKPALRIALLSIFVIAAPWVRASHSANEIWQDKSYLGSMDAFALGCIAAIADEKWGSRWNRGFLQWLGGAATIGIVWVLAVKKFDVFMNHRDHGFEKTILAGLTVFSIIGLRGLQARWLRPLAEIGRASYEIYLFHMFWVFAGVAVYRAVAPVAWNAWLILALVTAFSVYTGSWIEAHFSRRWLR
ncbi:MAG: acyltransferase [Bdellovibrionales bacterium]|nr:acyltransferase [Bdellovibrionales bacterium]